MPPSAKDPRSCSTAQIHYLLVDVNSKSDLKTLREDSPDILNHLFGLSSGGVVVKWKARLIYSKCFMIILTSTYTSIRSLSTKRYKQRVKKKTPTKPIMNRRPNIKNKHTNLSICSGQAASAETWWFRFLSAGDSRLSQKWGPNESITVNKPSSCSEEQTLKHGSSKPPKHICQNIL